MEQNKQPVTSIPAGSVMLEGSLIIPGETRGVVVFAHGSSRLSPRNHFVARVLREAGLATLLTDLLTKAEDRDYETRFDIDLLTLRLEGVTRWLIDKLEHMRLNVGYFGASTGAAAALKAAAALGPAIGAVVSRGGRPDLAWASLGEVVAPTLLIVGDMDHTVVELNRRAHQRLKCEKKLVLVPGATHLFEEPGALEEVARLAAEWFERHLQAG